MPRADLSVPRRGGGKGAASRISPQRGSYMTAHGNALWVRDLTGPRQSDHPAFIVVLNVHVRILPPGPNDRAR
jgi:hypothetical protein